jgi:hypothetical protein
VVSHARHIPQDYWVDNTGASGQISQAIHHINTSMDAAVHEQHDGARPLLLQLQRRPGICVPSIEGKVGWGCTGAHPSQMRSNLHTRSSFAQAAGLSLVDRMTGFDCGELGDGVCLSITCFSNRTEKQQSASRLTSTDERRVISMSHKNRHNILATLDMPVTGYILLDKHVCQDSHPPKDRGNCPSSLLSTSTSPRASSTKPHFN